MTKEKWQRQKLQLRSSLLILTSFKLSFEFQDMIEKFSLGGFCAHIGFRTQRQSKVIHQKYYKHLIIKAPPTKHLEDKIFLSKQQNVKSWVTVRPCTTQPHNTRILQPCGFCSYCIEYWIFNYIQNIFSPLKLKRSERKRKVTLFFVPAKSLQ